MLGELDRIRETPVEASELRAARDFLIGVFPLRFETAGAVVGALGSLAVHGLGVDELVGYRANVEAVGIDAIEAAGKPAVVACANGKVFPMSESDIEQKIGRENLDRMERMLTQPKPQR